MEATSVAPVDGRRARRERSRAAVIDAAFELLHEGHVPPSVEQVAARAGVSTASVFRYFDGLDDMQHQAFLRARERFHHLYVIPDCGAGPLPARIGAFVERRVALYEATAPMLLLARARAVDSARMREAVAGNREVLAEQVRRQFAPELARLAPSAASDRVALIDALTAPEAFAVMQRSHGRSTRRIARIWTAAVGTAIHGYEEST